MRMKNSNGIYMSPVYSIPFLLTRNKRRTVSIRISDEAKVLVYAPHHVSLSRIENFVDQKQSWIRIHQNQTKDKVVLPELDGKEKKLHADRVRRKAVLFLKSYDGKKPLRIFIRYSKTRWGSCSSLGNISLNGYLDLLPDDLFEYVMYHELTHLYYMNHSDCFWQAVSLLVEAPEEKRKRLDEYKIPSANRAL